MTEPVGEQTPEVEPSPVSSPRIYVASLSDYNAGRLHGEWIDADQEVEELGEAVGRMLATSPEPVAEEFAIHDYDGFGPASLGEYEPLERIALLAAGIKAHGPAFGAWAALVGTDPDQLKSFEEAYRGHWESVREYADQLLDDLGATEVLETVAGVVAAVRGTGRWPLRSGPGTG
jgi:antirestriction protein